MKKLFITLSIILTGFLANAQTKFCFVDSEYILKHIPEYKSAQTQLDDLAAEWQKEVDNKYAEIEKMYKSYQAEQVLLSDEMRAKREQEIVDKEKAVKEFQKAKFGYQGDLFKRREELVKPIQDKVFDAVNKYADQYSYGVIFDKSGDATMLYTSSKLDKSNDIIVALGYKPGDYTGAKSGDKSGDKSTEKSTKPAPKKK
jgi:outer membrane protein